MDSGTTIVNWQQAFEGYRIPQTRVVEKQLRSNAAQNKEKLRTLAGGSYRELLATAQAIVVLDEQTRVAENHLSSIGHNCRPPQQNATPRAPPPDKVALAQFRLLQRCCISGASYLRDQHLLQCARLVVISRLLLKSLSDIDAIAKSLDSLRNKLTGLRRQLLVRVEVKLINPVSKMPDLLEPICAYCLVTSTSAEDALGHLRQVRLEKIRRQLAASRQRSAICEVLQYQLTSLQTFKALVGRPIVEAMNELQRKPILADPSVRNMESLDLDRIFSLIPNDIRSFVPYFKSSTPTSEEMQLILEVWSQDACREFSDSLRQCVSDMNKLDEVLELRRQIYTLLLPSYFSTPAGSYIKERAAQALNERVSAICKSHGAQLDQCTAFLLDEDAVSRSAKPLWDSELALSSLDAGGVRLIKEVKKRHAGHNTNLSKTSRSMNTWISSANITLVGINEVSKIRWRDILEEPDEENEDDAAALIKMLSETDPKLYKMTLQASLQEAMLAYETNVAKAANKAMDERSNISSVVVLLRSIRASMTSLQQAFTEQARFENLHNVVPKLQQVVANQVTEELSKAIRRGHKANKWDKNILPDHMPSPRAFSTLCHLCKIMLDLGGTDLWAPPLVGLVKEAVSSLIFDPEAKSCCMDNEFDEAYLSIALGQGSSRNDTSKAKEVAKSASEYWTRTRLLFGVLA